VSETYNSTTEDVECPYCGHSNKLSDLYNDLQGPEDADAICNECEREYRVVFHVSVSVRAISIAGVPKEKK
jgi:hypothetical protein